MDKQQREEKKKKEGFVERENVWRAEEEKNGYKIINNCFVNEIIKKIKRYIFSSLSSRKGKVK